jgi:hypothetical protein
MTDTTQEIAAMSASIGNWPSHVVNGAIYTLPYDVLEGFRAGRPRERVTL